ncbi:glycosyltransferase family 4 protein [Vibrio nereis]|uniref:glycosyltransferase family 4 protein n=1 Tax=Vibrio nereis TaxID=693 RepID=UPI0024951497|nr:glycosyltransferase family 4 protein [Vibrio nereis]
MSKLERDPIQRGEIWLLIDTLTFGGIETHVKELAAGLDRFGQPVRVVVLKRYDAPQLLVKALNQQQLRWSFLADMQPQGHLLAQLYSAVRRYQPAVLHAHGYKASLCSKAVKLLTGVTQFSTYHAGETPTGRVWLYDLLDRYSRVLSNQAICVSPAIADKLPGESVVMNNFITQPSQIQASGEHIAFIGRLSHEKAPDRFVKLAQNFPKLAFHLYGDGPMYEELAQQAPANLTLHGHVNDMNEHWQSIALVVIPSRFEGLPMVALEAMGRGIPVLANQVGALPTLIEPGINGWLANSPDTLPNLLEHWHQLSASQKHHIGQNARSTVIQHYTEQAVIPELIALYQAQCRHCTLS